MRPLFLPVGGGVGVSVAPAPIMVSPDWDNNATHIGALLGEKSIALVFEKWLGINPWFV